MTNDPNKFISFITDYNVICIAIAVVLGVIFLVNIVYEILIYGRIASYRMMKKRKVRDSEPPVSVVVTLFAEDWDYLDGTLVNLLTQDYHQFEVVVVYVGNNNDFFSDLKALQSHYPLLTPVHFASSPLYPPSTKLALFVGIKSAKYECVITTSSDSTPKSNRWLSLLAKGFMYGDIVLGYCGLERAKGFKNFIFRAHQFAISTAWISAATRRRAYAASRSALGYTKELFFAVKGFNHLDMDIGEDDLFLQKIATPDNVSVVLSPSASCTERVWGGWSWWWLRVRRLHTTRRYYTVKASSAARVELIFRVLLFLGALAVIALLPLTYKLIALGLLVVRYLIVLLILSRNARRLGERGLVGLHFIYDIIEPTLRLFIAMCARKKLGKRGY
jgi:cellulose synthase/poly-beta-1,6-N-acetylglucosamine synthase-like glycosyltransferase